MHHLFEQYGEGFRHALATELRIAGESGPAVLGKGLEGVFETFRRGHFTIVPATALLVPFTVQREQQTFGHLACFFQNGIRQVAGYLGGGRHGGPLLIRFEHIVENKTHVLEGRFIDRHLHISRKLAGRKF